MNSHCGTHHRWETRYTHTHIYLCVCIIWNSPALREKIHISETWYNFLMTIIAITSTIKFPKWNQLWFSQSCKTLFWIQLTTLLLVANQLLILNITSLVRVQLRELNSTSVGTSRCVIPSFIWLLMDWLSKPPLQLSLFTGQFDSSATIFSSILALLQHFLQRVF